MSIERTRRPYDCFHDVNGTNLFEALIDLCEVGLEHGRPFTFT